MKPSVYLETTIISYLAARPSGDLIIAAHQKITRDWWGTAANRYELFISEAVTQEARDGDSAAAARRLALMQGLSAITLTPEHGVFAQRLLRETGLPTVAGLDAVHIAVAAMQAIDFLVTWNCKHIANPVFRPRIESFCRSVGLVPPGIVTPLEMNGMQ